MKLNKTFCSVLVIGLMAGCLSACSSIEKHHQAKLESEAKVTRADAEKTALAKVPNGTIKEGELEKEKGKLIWSFDIATPGAKDITEIAVDAKTGEVISMEKETPEDEEKEARHEGKE